MATGDTSSRSDWLHDVVDEIATRTGRDATDLPPVSHAIDVDALAALVDEARSDTVSVTFEYCGHVVEVDGTGAVTVERDGPTARRADE